MGKPTGWGGPWWEEPIEADRFSDPFLMTGFDQKTVHLKHDQNTPVSFTLEIDFLGNGTWVEYETITVPATGYTHHEFPPAFSAHWIRVKTDQDCLGSVYFFYN